MKTPDERVAHVAARQAGCISRAQALAAGVTDNMIVHRLRTGRWQRLHPGVYRIAGASPSWSQQVWSAMLAVGAHAVASHHTALLLHGVPDAQVARRPITLTVPAGQHHRVAEVKVFQRADLLDEHVTVLNGLQVTCVERSIVDIAALVGSQRHVGKILDGLISDRRTSIGRVGQCFDKLARPGRNGARLFAAVLDERGPKYVPPASKLEELLFDALAREGEPAPVRQIPLPGRGTVVGRADAGYPDARLLIEVDGRQWHTRLDDFRRDRERDAEAGRVGWLTLRFTFEQIRDDPGEVVATIREARLVRLKQFAGIEAASE